MRLLARLAKDRPPKFVGDEKVQLAPETIDEWSHRCMEAALFCPHEETHGSKDREAAVPGGLTSRHFVHQHDVGFDLFRQRDRLRLPDIER